MIAAVIKKMQNLVKLKEGQENFKVYIQIPPDQAWGWAWAVQWLWESQLSLEESNPEFADDKSPETAVEQFLLENHWDDRSTLIGISEREFGIGKRWLPDDPSPSDPVLLQYRQLVRKLMIAEDWEARAEEIAKHG